MIKQLHTMLLLSILASLLAGCDVFVSTNSIPTPTPTMEVPLSLRFTLTSIPAGMTLEQAITPGAFLVSNGAGQTSNPAALIWLEASPSAGVLLVQEDAIAHNFAAFDLQVVNGSLTAQYLQALRPSPVNLSFLSAPFGLPSDRYSSASAGAPTSYHVQIWISLTRTIALAYQQNIATMPAGAQPVQVGQHNGWLVSVQGWNVVTIIDQQATLSLGAAANAVTAQQLINAMTPAIAYVGGS